MSKFNKFLDEDNLVKPKIEKSSEEVKNQSYTSLKIKVDTLDTLRKLKIVTKDISYSALIDKMLEVYIESLPEEEKNNITLLRWKTVF